MRSLSVLIVLDQSTRDNTDDTIHGIVDSLHVNSVIRGIKAISVLPKFDLLESGGRGEKKPSHNPSTL